MRMFLVCMTVQLVVGNSKAKLYGTRRAKTHISHTQHTNCRQNQQGTKPIKIPVNIGQIIRWFAMWLSNICVNIDWIFLDNSRYHCSKNRFEYYFVQLLLARNLHSIWHTFPTHSSKLPSIYLPGISPPQQVRKYTLKFRFSTRNNTLPPMQNHPPLADCHKYHRNHHTPPSQLLTKLSA